MAYEALYSGVTLTGWPVVTMVRGRIARLERSIPRARRHERVRIAPRTTIGGHRAARTPRGEP